MRTCECCREYTLTTRPRALFGFSDIKAHLCDPCANEGHARQQCFLCGELIWNCAQLDHVQAKHPRVLERRANEPEDPQPQPTQRIIGRLPLDLLP